MKLPPLFNPSNDMALAANVRQYFPPRNIQQMEEDLADLSRLWDENPWGWSLATKQRYISMGIPKDELPTDEWLAALRQLSSREFGVQYYCKMDGFYGEHGLYGLVPCKAHFCTSLNEFPFPLSDSPFSILHFPFYIIKAPWSSSGRGNIIIRGEPDAPSLLRIRKIIQEQGGMVVEPFYDNKVLDFAMEFNVGNEGTDFVGFSVFSADETGHYGGNYIENQENLLRRIDLPAELLQSLIDYHRCELGKLPYRGPVGIDMMKLSDGRVHPCVEINFRMTMGLLAILLYNKGIRDNQLLTPQREHGFTCAIRQGRLCILVSK